MSWKDIEKNKTWQAMQRVRELTQLVADGKKSLQMFCSVPGLGKSETVLKVLADSKIKPHYSSPDSIQGFCADLWRNRETVYFLDDCDILAREEKLVNIAKMAYGPQRVVVVPNNLRIQRNEDWRISDDDRYDPDVPPPTFKLGSKHGLIWCSNKNFTDPAVVRANMKGDFAALISRGLDPLWIPSDPQSVFDYTIWMIMDGMLRRHPQQDVGNRRGGFKLDIQQEVLDFMCINARRLTEISPRMAWKLAMAGRDDPHYEEAWKQQLSPHVLYPSLILPDIAPRLIARSGKTASALIPQVPETVSEKQPDEAPANPEPLRRPLRFRKANLVNDIVYTNPTLASRIVSYFKPTGTMLDPCLGLGAFYNAMSKIGTGDVDWCEIAEGRDFLDFNKKVDWIITNPPWSSGAYRPILRHAFSLADNVVFLIRLQMAIASTARFDDEREFGFGQKEWIIINWRDAFANHEEMGYPLAAVHWKRDWAGGITETDWRAPVSRTA